MLTGIKAKYKNILCGIVLLAQAAITQVHGDNLPTGGVVTAGAVNIVPQGPTKLNMIQSTDKAAVNWQSFNIAKDHHVNIQQPSSSSVLLNRVVGPDLSSIRGHMTANGRVILVNSNGINVDGATINTNGFLFTTKNITDADFMSGKYHFAGDSQAKITLDGKITVARPGVWISMAAAHIEGKENLLLAAPSNRVILGGVESFSVDLHGDNLFTFKIDESKASHDVSVQMDSQSKMKADKGYFLLTTQDAIDTAANVVNASGIIEAANVNTNPETGVIHLKGGKGSKVTVGGKLSATGHNAKGGEIEVAGSQIDVAAATIDVSGDLGSGRLAIGGKDLQSKNKDGSKGDLTFLKSDHTTIAKDVVFKADAVKAGDGGKVEVWGDSLSVEGTTFARGGEKGGNGGFVEYSGKVLDINNMGLVDTRAPKGKTGTLLIDPQNIEIVGALSGFSLFDPPTTKVTAGFIQSALETTDLSLLTSSPSTGSGTSTNPGSQNDNICDITIATFLDLSKKADNSASTNATSLTLTAGGNIMINSGMSITLGNHNLYLYSGVSNASNTGPSFSSVDLNSIVSGGGTGTASLYYNNNAGSNYVQWGNYSDTGVSYFWVDNEAAWNSYFTGVNWNAITNDTSFSLKSDLTLSSTDQVGYGYPSPLPFSGYMDGKDHTGTIHTITVPNGFGPLFPGGIDNSDQTIPTIQNLTLTGGTYTTGTGGTGALAPSMTHGYLYNNTVNITSMAGGNDTGGLVGSVTTAGTIDHNTVNVTGSISGGTYVGGFAGSITNTSMTNNTINMVNGQSISGTDYVGGFVGQNTSAVAFTNNTANTTGTTQVIATGTNVGIMAGATDVALDGSNTSYFTLVGGGYTGGNITNRSDWETMVANWTGSPSSTATGAENQNYTLALVYTDGLNGVTYIGGTIGFGPLKLTLDTPSTQDLSGSGVAAFTGTFTGSSDSLFIDRGGNSSAFAGLFKAITGGTVTGLNLNFGTYNDSAAGSPPTYVGALAQSATAGAHLTNNTVTITGMTVQNTAGGLVGNTVADGSNIITGNTVTIGNGGISGVAAAGGIVGQLDGSSTINISGNTVATKGAFTSSAPAIKGGNGLGGIMVGNNMNNVAINPTPIGSPNILNLSSSTTGDVYITSGGNLKVDADTITKGSADLYLQAGLGGATGGNIGDDLVGLNSVTINGSGKVYAYSNGGNAGDSSVTISGVDAVYQWLNNETDYQAVVGGWKTNGVTGGTDANNYALLASLTLITPATQDIGALTNPNAFSGLFDGQGQTIDMTGRPSATTFASVFPSINNTNRSVPTVRGLTLQYGTYANGANANPVGALVGTLINGYLQNNTINITSMTGKAYVGGLVGRMINGLVTNNTVAVTDGNTISGLNYVGGLLGSADAGTVTGNTVTGASSVQTTRGSHVGSVAGAAGVGVVDGTNTSTLTESTGTVTIASLTDWEWMAANWKYSNSSTDTGAETLSYVLNIVNGNPGVTLDSNGNPTLTLSSVTNDDLSGAYAFSGTFTGATNQSITIVRGGNPSSFAGLFSAITSGAVTNLNLSFGTYNDTAGSGQPTYVGAIAQSVSSRTTLNNNVVTIASMTAKNTAGGLVGSTATDDNNTITNNTVIFGNGGIKGSVAAGGIVGQLTGAGYLDLDGNTVSSLVYAPSINGTNPITCSGVGGIIVGSKNSSASYGTNTLDLSSATGDVYVLSSGTLNADATTIIAGSSDLYLEAGLSNSGGDIVGLRAGGKSGAGNVYAYRNAGSVTASVLDWSSYGVNVVYRLINNISDYQTMVTYWGTNGATGGTDANNYAFGIQGFILSNALTQDIGALTNPNPFSGYFDGQGQILDVSGRSSSSQFASVFPSVNNANGSIPTIRRLAVTYGTYSNNGIGKSVGGLVGTLTNGYLDHNTVNITSMTANQKVGGLVGQMVNGLLTNNRVNLTNNKKITGANYAGGLVGLVQGGSVSNNTVNTVGTSYVQTTAGSNAGSVAGGLTGGTVLSNNASNLTIITPAPPVPTTVTQASASASRAAISAVVAVTNISVPTVQPTSTTTSSSSSSTPGSSGSSSDTSTGSSSTSSTSSTTSTTSATDTGAKEEEATTATPGASADTTTGGTTTTGATLDTSTGGTTTTGASPDTSTGGKATTGSSPGTPTGGTTTSTDVKKTETTPSVSAPSPNTSTSTTSSTDINVTPTAGPSAG